MEIPLNPPADWFDHPGEIPLDRRITITPEGRVYGYISLWNTCHAGMPGCVKPPKGSPSDYGYAHQGETKTADGTLIATANIGGGAGHAPIEHGAPPEFYENTSTQLMRVRYGDDENGLWFSGALWPDVNDMDVAKIRASSISGDWRWMSSYRKVLGGAYDFAGACFVNIPGYPMASAGDVALSAGDMQNIAASVNQSETFVPPGGVREAMERGLAWHKEGYSGDGLVAKTVREAKSIARGEPQSIEKIKRMRAWFARHGAGAEYGMENGKPTPGKVAWELWGGDAGKVWSESIMSRVEKGSIAATAQDAYGNILAMYAPAEPVLEEPMTCGGQCKCGGETVTAAADEKCPCGKMAAAECNCDGKNVTAAVEVEAEDDPEDAADGEAEQPDLEDENEKDMISALVAGMQDLAARMVSIEEMLAQITAAKMAENLAN
jgi:hypothetical protein